MTDEEALELGQRWVALSLPWMPGMLAIAIERGQQARSFGRPVTWRVSGAEIESLAEHGEGWTEFDSDLAEDWLYYQRVPDFRDPATLGCVLFQAESKACEHFGADMAYIKYDDMMEHWELCCEGARSWRCCEGATRVACAILILETIAALEAAQ